MPATLPSIPCSVWTSPGRAPTRAGLGRRAGRRRLPQNSLVDADADTYFFSPNPSQAAEALDCDDGDAGVHPGATEILTWSTRTATARWTRG